jgi:hypothetical protein
MHGRSRQQRSIRHPELRPADLTTENLELVPQHQQLNVLHVQTATTPNKRRKQRSKREIEKGEGHAADPPNPCAPEQRHEYWRPSGAAKPSLSVDRAVRRRYTTRSGGSGSSSTYS